MSINPCSLVLNVPVAGGVSVWAIFSFYTLGPLMPMKNRLNAAAYLANAADYAATILYWPRPHDNAQCHKSNNSDRLVRKKHSNEFSALVTGSQSYRASLGCDKKGDLDFG